ncbi:DUF3179 domain-containing protein [Stieleria sp. JC731]|uniref:DUF3179 domain-containing (seleno)protein n=1 Tax=Pirellulaceae TaxID=2691357 RepID=UPI001E30D889|nr:DUF3179 domain-containing (seleno)protein [Stieleria sp. JC731]MCC9601351.1 DUF3179 domain-containing protein [Stieleria sp. JC731]
MATVQPHLSETKRQSYLSSIIMGGIVCCSIPLGLFAYSKNTFSPQRQLTLRPLTEEQIAAERAREAAIGKQMAGNDNHPQIQALISFKGRSEPVLQDQASVSLSDSTEVIGVKVDGVECAFVLEPMARPENHILNMMLADKAVTVTYCDLANCVRVVTDQREESIPLNIGGLDIYNRMIVELDGELYAQSSKNLPLMDLPFERTTWGDWRRSNEETKIWIP